MGEQRGAFSYQWIWQSFRRLFVNSSVALLPFVHATLRWRPFLGGNGLTDDLTGPRRLSRGCCPIHNHKLRVVSINPENGDLQASCPNSTECDYYDFVVKAESRAAMVLMDDVGA